MKAGKTPTIKGVFVNSHIKALRKIKGEEGVRRLEQIVGKKLSFAYLQNVPVREEIHIIETALDIISENSILAENRSFEAGRLHFRNFSNTSLGKLVLKALPFKLPDVLLNIPRFAGHIFRNVEFTAERYSSSSIKITMYNNDYPIDHFKGLFYEVMIYFNEPGNVVAKEVENNGFEYLLEWK